ncbi:hypothetical protein BDV38DRAFT_261185 [Aspergillus pseudotamarii]|uniref:Uncharacterized protein n=1 Tax=Aspergillus pseudotamarii TaxID=132259 RepID=A0A5N6SEZ6_ASPPS|nr:uncharacterized protein BDV38DRAFT_261185 [Aspergillus pseudotamarii]KAE8132429.1 hypothetical protein BDV38DRAFT_261185 [Aspergillus pseudotamarii]
MWAMQNLGFERYYRQGPPPEEVVRAVEETYERETKYRESPTLHCLGGNECETFLRSRASEIEGIIERTLGVEFSKLKRQQPVIFQGEGGQSGYRMAHPSGIGADGFSVFGVVRGSASIVLYTGFLEEPGARYEPKLDNTELLAVPGQTFVEIRPTDGVLIVWWGFSRELILAKAASPFVLPFMVFDPRGRT